MPVLPFWQCHPNSPRQSETQFITMAGPSNPLKAALVLLIHCLLGIVFVNFRQAAVIPPPAHNLIAPLISLLIPALPLSACSSFNLGHNLFVCVLRAAYYRDASETTKTSRSNLTAYDFTHYLHLVFLLPSLLWCTFFFCTRLSLKSFFVNIFSLKRPFFFDLLFSHYSLLLQISLHFPILKNWYPIFSLPVLFWMLRLRGDDKQLRHSGCRWKCNISDHRVPVAGFSWRCFMHILVLCIKRAGSGEKKKESCNAAKNAFMLEAGRKSFLCQ